MTAYLIKNALCLLLFFVAYKVIFERERMHGFNRYYLLASILASLLIPLISFKVSIPAAPYLTDSIPATVSYIIEGDNNIPSTSGAVETATPGTGITLAGIITILYCTITAAMAVRLIIKLGSFIRNTYGRERISINGVKIMMVDWKTVPCAFWKTIYVNREDFEAGKIEDRIIHHENIHVRQVHSADRLTVEILQIFMWFNPLIYLYKKAILLNHEYIADRGVVDKYKDTASYLTLLVNSSAGQEYIQYPSSSFSSKTIKKRAIMMTKQKSRTKMLLKGFSVVPLLACSLILLSGRTIAAASPERQNETQRTNEISQQETAVDPQQPRKTVKLIPPSFPYNLPEGPGASQAEIDEYIKIENKYQIQETNGKNGIFQESAKDDVERLKSIFLKMTDLQRNERSIIFTKFRPLQKKTPTTEELNTWKDPKKYGVWLDGKRIDNSDLDKYKNIDFSYYSVSRLLPNAKNYGNHEFQLDLTTNEKFETDNKGRESDDGIRVLIKQKPKMIMID